jgi:K+-transporting ATPase ATPase C chain
MATTTTEPGTGTHPSSRPLPGDLLALARQTLAGLRVLLALTLVVGVAYPLVVLGIGRVAFAWQAGGSLVDASGRHQATVDRDTAGSVLIGQQFTGDRWFHGRPSAAGDGYDTLASAGTNLGPENPGLVADVTRRRSAVAAREGVDPSAVPPDATTSSGSGLDPDISPAYAAIQVARVARARGLQATVVRRLVREHTTGRTFGVLGEPRVDVLQLNIAVAGAAG